MLFGFFSVFVWVKASHLPVLLQGLMDIRMRIVKNNGESSSFQRKKDAPAFIAVEHHIREHGIVFVHIRICAANSSSFG